MFKIKMLFVKRTLIGANSELNDNYRFFRGLSIVVILTLLTSVVLFHSHLLPARNYVEVIHIEILLSSSDWHMVVVQ